MEDLIEAVSTAMQGAWNDFVADTGNIPDAFKIHGPPSTRVTADMHRGNFAQMVADRLSEPYAESEGGKNAI